MSKNEYECPYCHADLRNGEIPEEQRDMFGGATHFSRLVGRYDMEQDRTVSYQCPDCKAEWKR